METILKLRHLVEQQDALRAKGKDDSHIVKQMEELINTPGTIDILNGKLNQLLKGEG